MKTISTQGAGAPTTTRTGDASLDAKLDALRNAGSLTEIGAAIRALDQGLPGGPEAFRDALARRPGGVRPLSADLAPGGDVKLFCGEATPDAVKAAAGQLGIDIAAKDFKIFSTGDPFVFLGTPPDSKAGKKGEAEDVRKKTVVVVQGNASYTPPAGQERYDAPTLVAEALEIAFAAKSAGGAKKTIVVLPASLDPVANPGSQFAGLVARLAKATGVDEVRYNAALDQQGKVDALTSGGVRAGLPSLGPKTAEVGKWLDTLAGAQDLGAVSRSLAQLDIALTGLKGKYGEHAKAYARQVADVLTERMNALVPGLPTGVAASAEGRTMVFTGHSNPELARDLASQLGAELGGSVVQFGGEAPYAKLGTEVKDRPVSIVQTTRHSPDAEGAGRQSSMAFFFEALALCDEAKKAGASDVTLVLPYMPNARSDKSDQKGVGAYAAMVARWVDELDLGRVVLVEPHDIHVPAFFRTPVTVISGAEILTKQALEDLGRKDLVLVRPDEGATKRTKKLAEDLELPMVNGQKSRSDNSETAKVDALGNKSDVDGKICLVNDDEIATGGTMRQTVAHLKEMGAKAVHVAVSHANMPIDAEARHEAIRKLKDAGADSLYLLDTQPVGKMPADLAGFVRVVSAASAIAEEVR